MVGEVNFALLDPNMPAKVGTSWIQGAQLARQDTAQELQNQAAQQQYQNALAEAAAYKESGGDLNKLPQLLINAGLPKQAMGARKELREERKSNIDSRVQGLKLIEHHASNIYTNPTMDNAVGQIMTYAKSTGEDPTPLIAQLEATGGDPNKIKQFGLSYSLNAKDAITAAQKDQEIGIHRGQLGVSQGQLAETRRAHNLQYGPDVVANTITDEKGNVTQFNRYGEPIGAPGKVGRASGSAAKSLESIDQQRAIIQGSLNAVKNSPSAFGFSRGALGETIGGRMSTEQEIEDRSYLFNTISGVIKERAGTAQSSGERATLNRFLPLPTDNADIITGKLKAFDKYLVDKQNALTGTSKAPEEPKTSGLPSVSDIDAEIARRKQRK